ncbi:cell wall-binding protein [Pseudonocardia xinjiangensis]|uniref:Cell wall-binding protein n=1 Tax=Pseudonocardia xinjiangensis TaxID=75289 RepID=A0ABX1RKF2_9PSEU|nr:cell wall-binding protein [Pseudonocardia xinjiangensis]NMH79565.1 cell wall-binding protein [Pseudonocardia xinjiangensis]
MHHRHDHADEEVVRDRSLRAAYLREVAGLVDRAAALVASGLSEEAVARTLHAQRRALAERYKGLTSPARRARLYRRNVERYGDPHGPTVENLRAGGRSWADIILSSSRAGAPPES